MNLVFAQAIFLLDPFEFEKKKVSKYSPRFDIDHARFGVCEKEYWYFDCVDLYIELLMLLNCKFISTCRTCTFLLKWIINILIEKWDTIRFVELDNALFLTDPIKSFIYEPLILRFYCQNMCFIKDICKEIKHEEFKCNCHLELL